MSHVPSDSNVLEAYKGIPGNISPMSSSYKSATATFLNTSTSTPSLSNITVTSKANASPLTIATVTAMQSQSTRNANNSQLKLSMNYFNQGLTYYRRRRGSSIGSDSGSAAVSPMTGVRKGFVLPQSQSNLATVDTVATTSVSPMNVINRNGLHVQQQSRGAAFVNDVAVPSVMESEKSTDSRSQHKAYLRSNYANNDTVLIPSQRMRTQKANSVDVDSNTNVASAGDVSMVNINPQNSENNLRNDTMSHMTEGSSHDRNNSTVVDVPRVQDDQRKETQHDEAIDINTPVNTRNVSRVTDNLTTQQAVSLTVSFTGLSQESRSTGSTDQSNSSSYHSRMYISSNTTSMSAINDLSGQSNTAINQLNGQLTSMNELNDINQINEINHHFNHQTDHQTVNPLNSQLNYFNTVSNNITEAVNNVQISPSPSVVALSEGNGSAPFYSDSCTYIPSLRQNSENPAPFADTSTPVRRGYLENDYSSIINRNDSRPGK